MCWTYCTRRTHEQLFSYRYVAVAICVGVGVGAEAGRQAGRQACRSCVQVCKAAYISEAYAVQAALTVCICIELRCGYGLMDLPLPAAGLSALTLPPSPLPPYPQGVNAERYPEVMARMVRERHEVANLGKYTYTSTAVNNCPNEQNDVTI